VKRKLRRSLLALAVCLLVGYSARSSASVALAGQGAGDLLLALNAELAFYPNAVALSNSAACDSDDDPLGGACILTLSDDSTATAGMAVFGVQYPNTAETREVLGRVSDGSWQPWFRAQNVIYQLISLPGAMRVCAEGNLVDVRAGPTQSARTLDVLTDGTPLMADGFLLAQAGSFSTNAPPPGDIGWYHLTAPLQGWISSRMISDASLGTCSWHDALRSLS
jgi:hypothetical protein